MKPERESFCCSLTEAHIIILLAWMRIFCSIVDCVVGEMRNVLFYVYALY